MTSGSNPHAIQSTSRRVISLSSVKYDVVLGEDIKLRIPNVGNETLPLAWITHTDATLRQPLFSVVTDLLSTHSESYAMGTARAARSAFESSVLFRNAPITAADISSFIASDSPIGYQSFVRPLLWRLLELDEGLFDQESISLLRSDIKWEEGNGQYFRLMTNCSEGGALTDQELHNLHGALNRSYAQGAITQTDFTLMWMCIGTGLRPIQVARMRRSDVNIYNGPEGREVMLRVPLAKGVGVNNDYWLRRAPSVLAEVLISYLESTHGKADDALIYETSGDVSRRVQAVGRKLDTWSERLGVKIPITPYRFRYTLATRALAHGASDWEVARLLTHRSTSCIQFYRASMPELLNPIKSALGKELAYFARAFQGRLINDLSDATRKDDGAAEIMDFIHLTNSESIGACGTQAKCYMNAPVACLSCARFEPYRDAPWEELLESLLQDAEVENEERIKLINLNAMSAIKGIIAERDKEAANG